MNFVADEIRNYLSWKFWGDATSLTLLMATVADYLPPLAATLSIIWLLIRIYDTNLVQDFFFPDRRRLLEDARFATTLAEIVKQLVINKDEINIAIKKSEKDSYISVAPMVKGKQEDMIDEIKKTTNT